MDEPLDKFREILVTAIIGIFMALGKALITTTKSPPWQVVKTMAAGVFFCIGTALILTYSHSISPFWKSVICGLVAAGASTIWPQIERRLPKMTDKVIDNLPFKPDNKEDGNVPDNKRD